MNEQITIKELFSLDKTIATGIFEGAVYPWEVLSKIGDYIVGLGNSLPQKEYYKRGDNIWIHKEATVFDSAYIAGPAIICKGAEVRHCAFIRGKAVVGENAVVGNSTELKMSYCSIMCRFLIIITWEIQYWAIRHIWVQVQLHLM